MPTAGHDYFVHHSLPLYDPESLLSLGDRDNRVLLPAWELTAIEAAMTRANGVGWAARAVDEILENYRQRGSLLDGVRTERGGEFKIVYDHAPFADLPSGLPEDGDSRTILAAKQWRKGYRDRHVAIVSRQSSVRIRANICGIEAQDWKNDSLIQSLAELQSGILHIPLGEDWEPCFAQTDSVPVEVIRCMAGSDIAQHLKPNQCCCLAPPSPHGLRLGLYNAGQNRFEMLEYYGERVRKADGREVKGAINLEQTLALKLLANPAIHLVTMIGGPGTGKSTLALLAALEQAGPDRRYERIVIWRPNFEVGEKMGFLPGDALAKFAPWRQATLDTLHPILRGLPKLSPDPRRRGKPLTRMEVENVMSKLIEIEPINFVQGRTIPHAFVIVEEAQNLTPAQARMLMTRMGVGSKFVLVGDPSQTVNPLVNSVSNGLIRTALRLKGDPLVGYIALKEAVRSELAGLASRL